MTFNMDKDGSQRSFTFRKALHHLIHLQRMMTRWGKTGFTRRAALSRILHFGVHVEMEIVSMQEIQRDEVIGQPTGSCCS